MADVVVHRGVPTPGSDKVADMSRADKTRVDNSRVRNAALADVGIGPGHEEEDAAWQHELDDMLASSDILPPGGVSSEQPKGMCGGGLLGMCEKLGEVEYALVLG